MLTVLFVIVNDFKNGFEWYLALPGHISQTVYSSQKMYILVWLTGCSRRNTTETSCLHHVVSFVHIFIDEKWLELVVDDVGDRLHCENGLCSRWIIKTTVRFACYPSPPKQGVVVFTFFTNQSTTAADDWSWIGFLMKSGMQVALPGIIHGRSLLK